MTSSNDDGTTKDLTPDCVVQVDHKYGVVAEMRKHFRLDDFRKLEQIKKYDSDLIGWWTDEKERIEHHDLVLLTHQMSGTNAKDTYAAWIANGNKYERPFSIVTFNYSDQGGESLTLQRIEGKLTDPLHDEALRQAKGIPVAKIREIYTKFKLYDDPPPLIHILLLLRSYIFPLMFKEVDFDQEGLKKKPSIEVTIPQIKAQMQIQFLPTRVDHRQPDLPKTDWIRDAMTVLVKMKLAVKLPNKVDTYRVVLKKPSIKDEIRFLALKLLQIKNAQTDKREKELPPRQPDLFLSDGTSKQP